MSIVQSCHKVQERRSRFRHQTDCIFAEDRDQATLVIFADEHRRLVEIAIHAYSAIKTGNVGLAGATGTLLIHALIELQSLGERTLPEIRLASPDVISVAA